MFVFIVVELEQVPKSAVSLSPKPWYGRCRRRPLLLVAGSGGLQLQWRVRCVV